jgi:hypothetical protein
MICAVLAARTLPTVADCSDPTSSRELGIAVRSRWPNIEQFARYDPKAT